MSLEYGFNDRMDAAKAVAQDRRNRGLPTGKPAAGWAKRKSLPADTEENRLYAEMAGLRRELANAHNTIDQMRLSGGDAIEDFGAEFDRLVGRGLPASPPSQSTQQGPRGHRGAHTMTTAQYLKALKNLDLSPASKATAAALGLSVRQCQRIAAGQDVPETLAKLLECYLAHGLPQDKR